MTVQPGNGAGGPGSNQNTSVSASQAAPNGPDDISWRGRLGKVENSLNAAGAVVYHWNIANDLIEWAGDTTHIFPEVDAQLLETGRGYASLLDPDNFTSRFETVMRTKQTDTGDGVPFSIEYSIKPYGRNSHESLWVEDHGRWFAGPDGQPAEVYGVVRQIDERHKQDQQLQFLGNCDPLTGMMNRGRLGEALGEIIELAKVENNPAAFLIVAVNNIGIVNDAYGYDVADEVIMEIGRRLRKVVRTGDMIGRYSGSKFGIILANCDSHDFAIAAERFLEVARHTVIDTASGPVWATLSIGGVVLPDHASTPAMAMARTEEALTEALRLPSDGFVLFAPSEDVVSERKLNSRCAVEIVSGLKHKRFAVAYQPIVRSDTREVALHEALLRMVCDNGDIVTAAHLVPVAEKLGLIRLIDRTVMGLVVTALKQYPSAHIALNISGVTANDPRWFGQLTEILSEHRDVTDRLTVEITETVAISNIDQTVMFTDTLRELGCKIAIDDFGVGYTSFRNLKLMNVDKVKIDGSFIKGLSQNVDNQYFVQSLVDLARKFNIEIVAEWVETEEDAALLTSWGVDYLQGSLFGMAADGSQWGEPVIDASEVVVEPAELREISTERESPEEDGACTFAETEKRAARRPRVTGRFSLPGSRPSSDSSDSAATPPAGSSGQPFEVRSPDVPASFPIPDLDIEVETASPPPLPANETFVPLDLAPDAPAMPGIQPQPEDKTPVQDKAAGETAEQAGGLQPGGEYDSSLEAELVKLREAIRLLDQAKDMAPGPELNNDASTAPAGLNTATG